MVPVKSLRASNCTVARCPRRARILVAYGRLRFRGRMTNHPSKNPASTPAWSASITAHGAAAFPEAGVPPHQRPLPSAKGSSGSRELSIPCVYRRVHVRGQVCIHIRDRVYVHIRVYIKIPSASRSVPPPSAPPITPVTIFNTGTTNPPTIKQLNRVCRSTVSPPLLSTISNQKARHVTIRIHFSSMGAVYHSRRRSVQSPGRHWQRPRALFFARFPALVAL